MATNFTYATLTTAIQDYTEVTTDVFTSTITDGFITDAETRILRDVNIDADRKSQTGSLVVGQEYINAPAGCLVVRSVQVTEDDTSPNTLKYLEKRDVTFLNEYNNYGTAGTTVATGRDIPKYYAMFGGATGFSEAFGYLKGPQDMLTYYEQRYNKEVEKFAIEQVGRRRRDDYDDGTIRIKIDSPSP